MRHPTTPQCRAPVDYSRTEKEECSVPGLEGICRLHQNVRNWGGGAHNHEAWHTHEARAGAIGYTHRVRTRHVAKPLAMLASLARTVPACQSAHPAYRLNRSSRTGPHLESNVTVCLCFHINWRGDLIPLGRLNSYTTLEMAFASFFFLSWLMLLVAYLGGGGIVPWPPPRPKHNRCLNFVWM
jgi:hypothetical protein